MTGTPLAFEDAFELLGPALPSDDVVLVGGQAVNYWLGYYRARDTSLANIGLVTSDDVDFLGVGDAATRMARQLAGSAVTLTTLDDASPNSAVVYFDDRNGQRRCIDFLSTVHGLDTRRVRDTAILVELTDLNGKRTGIVLRVLHPVLCLASRIHNTGLPGYRSTRALRQARAAIACARAYIVERCDDDDLRGAHRAIKRIGELARTQVARRAHAELALDVLEAIPDDPRLGSECLTKTIPLLRRRARRPE